MLTILFLIGLVVVAVAAVVLTEIEYFGWATVLLIATLGVAQLLHMADVPAYVRGHAGQILLYALIYVVAGVAWSFAKWFSYLISYRDKFREAKAEFLKSKNLNPIGQVPDEYMSYFRDFLRNEFSWDRPNRGLAVLVRPQASDNKARIVAWMSLWPLSFIGTVLNDPIRRLFNSLFNRFKALYQKMSDKVFAKDVELK
jgi:hypothetical protein